MPRTCTVCQHPQRGDIEAALLAQGSLRTIADRWSVSKTALIRHRDDHLPAALVQAKAAGEVARADDLLGQVQGLQTKALDLLRKAEADGDYRTALAGIREARGCLELLAELTQQLDRRPQVNILLAPEWLAVRFALLAALHPYPEARAAVASRLLELEAGDGHGA
ncbi:MAG: hypothetical protein ACM3US_02425 [Sphingomonadaceae bacterium]